MGDGERSVAIQYPENDALVILDPSSILVESPRQTTLQRIIDADVIPSCSSAQSIYLLKSSFDGVQLAYAGTINAPLQEKNYSTSVVDAIQRIIHWADSPNPYGRIVIFAGPPGTGKGYAVRAIITGSENVEWVFCPPKSVPSLTRPDAIEVLMSERNRNGPLGLIVEDAEDLLRCRIENSGNVVSEILNLGDGLIGDIADMRLILTTNLERLEIDKALLRPGRLFSFVQFEALPPAQAEDIFAREREGRQKTFTTEMTLAEIYGCVRDHENGAPGEKDYPIGQYV